MSWTLVPLTANWGRHVSPAEFRANVLATLAADDRAVLGIQELDEADAPDEHAILRAALDPKDKSVGWRTMEPIVVPWTLNIRRRFVTLGCKGLAGYTPTRYIVEAEISNPIWPEVPPVIVMNQHPPINRPATATRRWRQRAVHKRRVAYWYRLGYTVVWMGDMNDPAYPRMHRLEQTAVHAGLDYIRWIEHPRGAQVELRGVGTVDLTIDGHNAHFARLRLTPPKEKK